MNADGSAVTGSKLAEAAAPGTIPWLLPGATPKAPAGQLAPASYIQRIATTGGLTPTALRRHPRRPRHRHLLHRHLPLLPQGPLIEAKAFSGPFALSPATDGRGERVQEHRAV